MYDAIVVGARCAGAPTAMLLARKGYRVLLVDRNAFPSDTISTHLILLPGVARLKRWGVLDSLVASGCPPLDGAAAHFNDLEIKMPIPPTLPRDVPPLMYAPRRTILDKLLVDAAVEAGAELREKVSVTDLKTDGDTVTGIRGRHRGKTIDESARIVIGADGQRSTVARLVKAQEYDTKPSYSFVYYSYWSNVSV